MWNYRRYLLILMTLFLFSAFGVHGQQQNAYEINSPDQTIKLIISVEDQITYSVIVDGNIVVAPSRISMSLDEDVVLGRNPKIRDEFSRTVKQEINPVVPEKFAIIEDHFNELVVTFENSYSLIFRTYNNGVAYRFETKMDKSIKVLSEQATFNFTGTNYVYFPEEESFFSHNERAYHYMQLDTMSAGRLASLPVLIDTQGPKVLITESSLLDYPGMWVKSSQNSTLKGAFPRYALESQLRSGSDRDVPVTKYADYIAKTDGKRRFPWRILAIARKDADLITNQLVYQLAEESRIEDPSWITPGKVAWDWWNANNLYGVDFRAGVNTETYKYYIDFASRFGIEYIILDEGWYQLGNLMEITPEMNVRELVDYGKKKNVGIILWVVWKTLDDQLDQAFDQFAELHECGLQLPERFA